MAAVVRQYRLHAVAFALGLILGVAGYARIGPDAASIDPGVQAGLLLVVSVTLAATAGAAGAVLGASISATEARTNREEAREARAEERRDAGRARYGERKLSLTVDLLLAADVHRREAEAQVNARADRWWLGEVEGEWDASGQIEIPTIGPSEPVRRAAQAIDIVAPLVAPAAEGLYASTVRVGESATHYQDQGTPPGDKWWDSWKEDLDAWADARARFVEAVREDLGVNPVPVTGASVQ
jgi:hypothetical protein